MLVAIVAELDTSRSVSKYSPNDSGQSRGWQRMD